MAISLVTGSAQGLDLTATQTLLIPNLDAFSYSKDDPGESVFTSVSAALDQPNAIRHAVSSVADVFKNTPVVPEVGQRVDGLSVLTQVTEVWKVYDATDASVKPYYLPVSAHFVLRFPNDALVVPQRIWDLTLRLLGATCRAAADDPVDQMSKLMHGITRL